MAAKKKGKPHKAKKVNTQEVVVRALLARREALIAEERREFEKLTSEVEDAHRIIEDARSNIEDIGYQHQDEMENLEGLLDEYNVSYSETPDWESEFDDLGDDY